MDDVEVGSLVDAMSHAMALAWDDDVFAGVGARLRKRQQRLARKVRSARKRRRGWA